MVFPAVALPALAAVAGCSLPRNSIDVLEPPLEALGPRPIEAASPSRGSVCSLGSDGSHREHGNCTRSVSTRSIPEATIGRSCVARRLCGELLARRLATRRASASCEPD